MPLDFSADRNVSLGRRLLRQAQNLAAEFAGIFNFETIHRYVQESADSLQNVRVPDYVHLLAGRFAQDRLKALARVQGNRKEDFCLILYLCNHNAGRSQMAAAFTAHLGQDRVSVMSAGSTPASEVNTVVVQAMEELEIDLSDEFPKPAADEVVHAADIVVTMGCGEACPVYPGKRYLDWEVADPAGQPLEVVRAIRDDIRHRVENLLTELGVLAGARGEDSQRHVQHVDSA
jgi:arsenate reductase (thioredoxin)